MRALDAGMQAALDGGATTLCRCWLLVRQDGQRMGFTDHDRDVHFAGDIFTAETGLSGSALETATGLANDNAQVFGALSAVGLQEADILTGRYDRAEIWHWMVDWTNAQSRLLLFQGRLGEIERGATAFEAEIRGLSDDLNHSVGRAYVPSCDARLGDARCQVVLDGAPYVFGVPFVAQISVRRLQFAPVAAADDWFARGYLHWQTGALAGLKSLIRSDWETPEGRVVELWEDMLVAPAKGDLAQLIAGCDKNSETCRAKFANFMNFRGFPHIPGEDWVTAVPSRTTSNDGGKIYVQR